MNKKLKSFLGYRKDSPFKDEPYIDIQSNNIDMSQTDRDLILIPNKGKPVIAKAGSGGYLFPNSTQVREIPLYQQGGQIDSNQVKKFDKEKLKAVQLDLKSKGLYKGKIDGIYGRLTQQAIDNYNKDKTIESDYELTVTDSKGSTRTLPINPQTIKDKQKVLEEYGILPEQTQGRTIFSDRLASNINPIGYDNWITRGFEALTGKKEPERELLDRIAEGEDVLNPDWAGVSKEDAMRMAQSRIDTWNLYLGLPQKYNKVKISNYKPTKSSENRTYYSLDIPDNVKEIIKQKGELRFDVGFKGSTPDTETGVMGNFKIDKGKDSKGEYISYYDKWDLAPDGISVDYMGKPIEFYDRIYLDKKYQAGGVSMKPVSPFMDLKMFKNRYKLEQLPTYQMGGILDDYIKTLPEEQQNVFMGEFQSLEPDVQQEVIFMLGGKYQMGGTAEVEGDETAVLPDSELVEFKGKKHKDGGIKVDLPNGTRIYSEYSTAPVEIVEQVLGKKTKGKMSYADLSKKFPTKPYMEILENEKSDEYEKNGAQLKLMNNLSKLDTIFYAQETEKKTQGKTFQQGGQIDWTTGQMYQPDTVQYPTIHQEPYPTVSTGVRLNLMEPKIDLTYDLDLPGVDIVAKRNQPVSNITQVRSKQSNKRTKPVLDLTNSDSALLEVPLPFGQLPTADLSNRQVTSIQVPETAPTLGQDNIDTTDYTDSQDDKDYPVRARENKFGISSKLAGTIADIGLALSDKLRVSEPTLYDRRKYPLFTRFVDFDDKEVQRMYDKGIQQIQNSNLPEAQKQAQITELLSKYQDYQGKVDYNNLQRYENKREGDTNKLQSYLDQNIDIKVADTQDYKERKSRVDYLRDQFLAQRKSRVVNSLKAYADYVDTISRANELYTDNYLISPITGKISYRPTEQSKLSDTESLVAQYRQNANNKVSLPNGATLTMLNESTGIVTDSNGKTEIVKLK